MPVKPPPLPEADQNRVALLVPLTGPNAPVGQSIANAANMALLDVGDKRVNLRIYDTTPGAGTAASKAIADGARLILGPLLANDIKAVDAAAGPRGIPVLSYSNDASLAGGNVYILGFQPAQSIARSIAYAASRGIDRFAALVPCRRLWPARPDGVCPCRRCRRWPLDRAGHLYPRSHQDAGGSAQRHRVRQPMPAPPAAPQSVPMAV